VPIRWDPFHVVVVVVDVVVDVLVVGSAQTSGPTKNASRRLTTAEKRLYRLVSRLVPRLPLLVSDFKRPRPVQNIPFPLALRAAFPWPTSAK
jgi:hypothetical protein